MDIFQKITFVVIIKEAATYPATLDVVRQLPMEFLHKPDDSPGLFRRQVWDVRLLNVCASGYFPLQKLKH